MGPARALGTAARDSRLGTPGQMTLRDSGRQPTPLKTFALLDISWQTDWQVLSAFVHTSVTVPVNKHCQAVGRVQGDAEHPLAPPRTHRRVSPGLEREGQYPV